MKKKPEFKTGSLVVPFQVSASRNPAPTPRKPAGNPPKRMASKQKK